MQVTRSVATSLQGTAELKMKKKKIFSRSFTNFITLRLHNIAKVSFFCKLKILSWRNWTGSWTVSTLEEKSTAIKCND